MGKGCKIDAGGARGGGPLSLCVLPPGALLQRKSPSPGDEVDTLQSLPVLLTRCIVSVEAKGAPEGLCSTAR